MNLNAKDGGHRKFIVVQLPENAERSNFSTISELSKQRIRTISRSLIDAAKTQLLDNPDFGFRVLSFNRSNFKQWQDFNGENIQALEQQFASFETPLVDDWKEVDLLTEVMLLQGFPLDSRIETLPNFSLNMIRQIRCDFHAHSLYICLDPKINHKTIDGLVFTPEDIFVCLDSALSDETKMRLADHTNLRVI